MTFVGAGALIYAGINFLKGFQAWMLKLEQRDLLAQLGHFALHQLDVPLATRVYRELGDAGMVMAMQKLEGVDDAALLAGHVALVCGYHDLAQELFLASSHPISALEMRRDLLDWEVALKLAQTLAPDQVPSISREFAMQLEFREEYEPALAMFNNGLATRDAGQAKACRAGVARMTLRLGDVSRGERCCLYACAPLACAYAIVHAFCAHRSCVFAFILLAIGVAVLTRVSILL